MHQNEAYREWYALTSGAKDRCDASHETYYFLGRGNNAPIGRHSIEENEDDFSIRYLLNKSFGD
jgi:hypothetical protein